MPYILSKANRFYTALENSFGTVPAITAFDRIPAVKLAIRQQLEVAERRDKTGSRTFTGLPPGGRRRTSFELNTYLTNWANPPQPPSYGPLFQAALGSDPMVFAGGTAGAGSSGTTLVFNAPHRLADGQAITYSGEMRFIVGIPDSVRVLLNAPFSVTPGPGAPIGPTVTYTPATDLPSVSVFDYWSPDSAVQRVLCGAAVDRMLIRVNADYHEFEFSGLAQDVLDSSSLSSGLGQLSSFPAEPALDQFEYSVVPGHMGQAWIGPAADRFYTVTSASFLLDNDVSLRAQEFGSNVPRWIAPGRRSVFADFTVFEQDDAATISLYQAARQQSPVPVMFQLGEQNGQLMGVYLKSVVPEVPEFDDSDTRLQWRFRESRAQGTLDDEMTIAFG